MWLEQAFTTHGVYRIEGAAGVGKSVMTYWCVTAIAKRAAKNLIYLHKYKGIISFVVYSASDMKFKFGQFVGDLRIERWLKNVYRQFDVLVIDGKATQKFISLALSFHAIVPLSIVICMYILPSSESLFRRVR